MSSASFRNQTGFSATTYINKIVVNGIGMIISNIARTTRHMNIFVVVFIVAPIVLNSSSAFRKILRVY